MTNDTVLEQEKQEVVEAAAVKPEAKLIHGTQINEDEEAVEIISEAAGYNRDNLEITVEARQLKITSKEEAAAAAPGRELIRQEYASGGYARSFRLSEKIDVEQITASVKDGVLRIRLPKHAAAQKRHIEVKSV